MSSYATPLVSGICMIRPFEEGNTRTIAMFATTYLKLRGHAVDNTSFIRSSWHLRNTLARANHESREAGIFETQEYLGRFPEDLLLGGNLALKNPYLHVGGPEAGLGERPDRWPQVKSLLDSAV
jgi:hypothetical protein